MALLDKLQKDLKEAPSEKQKAKIRKVISGYKLLKEYLESEQTSVLECDAGDPNDIHYGEHGWYDSKCVWHYHI